MLVIRKTDNTISKFTINIVGKIKEMFIRHALADGVNSTTAEEKANEFVEHITDDTTNKLVVIIDNKFYEFIPSKKGQFKPIPEIPFPSFSLNDKRANEFQHIKEKIIEGILTKKDDLFGLLIKFTDGVLNYTYGQNTSIYKSTSNYFSSFLNTDNHSTIEFLEKLISVIFSDAFCILEMNENNYLLTIDSSVPVIVEPKAKEKDIHKFIEAKLGKYFSPEEVNNMTKATLNFLNYHFFYPNKVNVNSKGLLEVEYKSAYGNIIFTGENKFCSAWYAAEGELKNQNQFYDELKSILPLHKVKRNHFIAKNGYPNGKPWGTCKQKGWIHSEVIRHLENNSNIVLIHSKQPMYNTINGYSYSDSLSDINLVQLNFYGCNEDFVKLINGQIGLPEFFWLGILSSDLED